VKEVVPNCQIEFAPGAGPDKRCYRVDCSKIARMIPEFKPQWNARKGVRELYDAYRAVNLSLEDFQSTRYSRIDYIKGLLKNQNLDSSLRWTAKAAAGVGEVPVAR
jgi:hypothetical protein